MRAWIFLLGAAAAGCAAEPTGSSTALATGDDIASIALGQIGGHACYPQVYGSSCTGNGGQPEYWCADFAKWVWQQAGADASGLTAAAGSFYVYGQNHGTLHDWPSVGDAVVFDYAGGGYADHVALVTRVNSNGTIETVSGDWGGSGSSEAAFSSTSTVALNAPAFYGTVGSTPVPIGMTISGFISPAGVTGSSNGGCGGYEDGFYCGGDYIQGDSSTLYRCSGGDLAVEQQCGNGCQVMPNGKDDVCAPPASACAGYYDGLYCGGDYIPGDSSTLYRCTSGSLSVEQVCANGCQMEPNGLDDQCD